MILIRGHEGVGSARLTNLQHKNRSLAFKPKFHYYDLTRQVVPWLVFAQIPIARLTTTVWRKTNSIHSP